MDKPLKFKNFLATNYTSEISDQTSYNVMERPCGRVVEELENEALNFAQRRARGLMMKRIKSKLKLGRAKAQRKTASIDTLKKRTAKQVRNTLFKKFSKNTPRSELSPAMRQSIEKRINSLPASRVAALIKRELPKTRKKEMLRKSQKVSGVTK